MLVLSACNGRSASSGTDSDSGTDTAGMTESGGTGSIDQLCEEAREEVAECFDEITAEVVAFFEAGEDVEGCENPHPAEQFCPHGCFDGQFEVANSGITPPLGIGCDFGDDPIRCESHPMGNAAGFDYGDGLWVDNRLWNSIEFGRIGVPHLARYALITENTIEGESECTFTVEGYTDLDQDNEFARYRVVGHIDANGVEIEDMTVVDECE